jgi:hypothetical protein
MVSSGSIDGRLSTFIVSSLLLTWIGKNDGQEPDAQESLWEIVPQVR